MNVTYSQNPSDGFRDVPLLQGALCLPLEVDPAGGVMRLYFRCSPVSAATSVSVPSVRVHREEAPPGQVWTLFRVLINPAAAGGPGEYLANLELGGCPVAVLLRIASVAGTAVTTSAGHRRQQIQAPVRPTGSGPDQARQAASTFCSSRPSRQSRLWVRVLLALLVGALLPGAFLWARGLGPRPVAAVPPSSPTGTAQDQVSPGEPPVIVQAQEEEEPDPTSSPTPTGSAVENLAGLGASRRLTHADLQGMSARDLTLARNSLYARHGRPFKDAELRRYFQAQPWYREDPSYQDSVLSPLERANAGFIMRYQETTGLTW